MRGDDKNAAGSCTAILHGNCPIVAVHGDWPNRCHSGIDNHRVPGFRAVNHPNPNANTCSDCHQDPFSHADGNGYAIPLST